MLQYQETCHEELYDGKKIGGQAVAVETKKRPRTKIRRPAAMTSVADDKSTEAKLVNVRRRQGRSVATCRKILDSALQEFATMGFDGATTRSIAERANVPHGLVIYHFETKLGIWQAVMESALAELHEHFEQVLLSTNGDDPGYLLRETYAHFIRMSGRKPELSWLFSHEVAGQSERLHWLLNRIRGQNLQTIFDIIHALQSQNRFVQGDPAHLHFMFMGAAMRVFDLAPQIEHYIGMSPFEEKFIEQHVDLCLGLFFR
jgi:TetR/AcrR family transcriptional regulator